LAGGKQSALRTGSRAFLLDSFFEVSWSRSGNALKMEAQRPALADWHAFGRRRVKNPSPSRKRAPRALDPGAKTGV